MPQIAQDAFVAPTASVIGDVTLGQGSSVWYGAKVRGDTFKIQIGSNTSIGDCVMVILLHHPPQPNPLIIIL